nr:alpha-mannosidase [Tanacetum cinerariifolium]
GRWRFLLDRLRQAFAICKTFSYNKLGSEAAGDLTGRRLRGPDSFSLGDALGIAQHHDVVTSTAKQHTTNDYEKRLAIGGFKAEDVVTSDLSCLTSPTSNCTIPTSTLSGSKTSIIRNRELEGTTNADIDTEQVEIRKLQSVKKHYGWCISNTVGYATSKPLRRSLNLENDEQKKNVMHTMLPRWLQWKGR